jgi:hypothetical protein
MFEARADKSAFPKENASPTRRASDCWERCESRTCPGHIETKGVLDEDFGVAGVIDKVLQGLEDGIVEITAAIAVAAGFAKQTVAAISREPGTSCGIALYSASADPARTGRASDRDREEQSRQDARFAR